MKKLTGKTNYFHPYLLLLFAVIKIALVNCDSSRIRWSGYDWNVKIGYRKPGPNFFSDLPFVHDNRLFLIASKSPNGSWMTSEIYSRKSFGYGTYRFNVSTDLSSFDPNVVLGLFTWDRDPAFANREIDIEIAKWNNPKMTTNGQYAIQPVSTVGNLRRFNRLPGNSPSTEQFIWTPEKIRFSSFRGNELLSQWTYKGNGVPKKGREKVHINLWLSKGKPPLDRRPVIIVIDSFEFTPLRRFTS